MDIIIEFLGRDTFMALAVWIGCVIRAGRGEKVPILDGLISAFAPFFLIMCLLYIFEWIAGLFGMQLDTKPIGAFGGLCGYLASYWVAALQKDGQSIAETGAAGSLVAIVKSIITFKKP